MELREKLCSLRKENGISQLEIAERLEVSRQTVSRWETGAAVPTAENLMRLSALYGVPLDELVREDWLPPDLSAPEAEPDSSVLEPPAQEQRQPQRGRLLQQSALRVVILAVVLLAGIAVGIWVSHQKDSNAISTSDIKSEVIDFSTITVEWSLLPPTE